MERWVEAADWIVWQLCGEYVRNACTAGYKGILQDGRYPCRGLPRRARPGVRRLRRRQARPADRPLGRPRRRAHRATAAAGLGLPEGIAVAVGNVDAHVTAPAARAVEPGQLVAIMGTSTCHVVNGDELREVPGMCGVVDGGIVDGLWGYEAGQSGRRRSVRMVRRHRRARGVPRRGRRRGVRRPRPPPALAAAQAVGQHGLLALDWHNGNRSVLVNHELSGLVVGLTVATRPEDVYRALMEATAFGARTIVETLTASGVPVDGVHRGRRADEEPAC